MGLYGYFAFIMPYFPSFATSTYDSNAVVNGAHSDLWENKSFPGKSERAEVYMSSEKAEVYID